MGWLDRFRKAGAAPDRSHGSLAYTAPADALASIVFPKGIFEGDGPVTRDEALKVPALFRAVSLLAGVVSRLRIENAPQWIDESFGKDSFTFPLALYMTVEDLILNPDGDAIWIVDRDGSGSIVEGAYVRREDWQRDQDGHVWILGTQLPDPNVIYFTAGRQGLQHFAADTIRQYTSLSKQLLNAARMPNPRIIVEETQTFTGSAANKEEAVQSLKTVLQAENGGIAWSPYGLKLNILNAAAMDSLSAARNDIRLDIANFTGLDPDYLAGSKNGGSDTYSNALQGDREFAEFSVKRFSEVIISRLNQSDVLPRGAPRLAFDYSGIEEVSQTSAAANTETDRKTQ